MKSIECMLCKYKDKCNVKHLRYRKKSRISIGGDYHYHCKKKNEKEKKKRNEFWVS